MTHEKLQWHMQWLLYSHPIRSLVLVLSFRFDQDILEAHTYICSFHGIYSVLLVLKDPGE